MMPHRFLIALLALPLAAQVNIKQTPDRISVEINGKPFTELWIGPEVRKPILYPLYSATGKAVTRRWPMEQTQGESKDHPHHRGLSFTHGDVNGMDFWSSDPLARQDARVKIALTKVHSAKGGKKDGKIEASFDWLDKSGKPVLHEARTMKFYAEPDRRTLDLDIKLTAATEVKFGDTKEGSLGIRLADALAEQKGRGNGKMTNAEGAEGEKAVWGKPSPWVDYGGMLDGEQVGITIMDHPSNPRHPTHWHSRAYGLFAANIFGMHDFYNDKSKDGSLQLKNGETLRFRYRIVIHPGDAKAAAIADAYKKFSAIK
ncbi:MAG TPA: PmoA family protein [Bryobacteraceae bacterium]|nr:PmoA family protein [Bryobacteraceae bacterium]